MLVHYKGPYSVRSLCQRPGKTTPSASLVTCPKCREKIARQRDADKDLGNYDIKDDMVGTARIRREGAKVTLGYLKQLIEKALKRPTKKPVAKKQSPASLMKQITDALATLGYKVGSREKNSGSLKAWMDPVGGRPKPVYRDEDDYSDLSAPPPEPVAVPSPGRIAMKYKKALAAAGLPVTVSGDRYETALRGKGFDVILAPEGGGDIGAAIFVQVFAGKRADLERSGFDTTDLGEGVLREYVEKPMAELEAMIAAMGPDDVAEDDYVDSDTGEIYLEKGRKARTSQLHPEYMRDHQAKRAAQQAAWAEQDALDAKEDEEWENEKARARKEAEDAWIAALTEYAGNWTDFKQSMGDEWDEDNGQSAAMDAAEGFFHQFPEWKRWAVELGMKKHDMQSAIADYVYEAITTGEVPN